MPLDQTGYAVPAMEQHDLERILRDVLSSTGMHATILRVERAADGWRVTVTDQADRIVTTDLPDDSPSVMRAALTRWVDTQS